MNKYAVERAIIANRPGEPFVLVERVDGDNVKDLSTLEWQAPTDPPTWKEAKQWTTALVLEDERAAACEAAKKALAESDVWVIRHVEDGYSLTEERRAYRDELRAIVTEAPVADAPQDIVLPDVPPPPEKPS